MEEGLDEIREQRYDTAIEPLSRSLQLRETLEGYSNRARANLYLHNFTQAELDATSALEIDNTHASSYLTRGMAKQALSRQMLMEAIVDLRRAEGGGEQLGRSLRVTCVKMMDAQMAVSGAKINLPRLPEIPRVSPNLTEISKTIPESKPEPKSEPKLESKSEPKPEPKSEPKPEPKSEAKSKPHDLFKEIQIQKANSEIMSAIQHMGSITTTKRPEGSYSGQPGPGPWRQYDEMSMEESEGKDARNSQMCISSTTRSDEGLRSRSDIDNLEDVI